MRLCFCFDGFKYELQHGLRDVKHLVQAPLLRLARRDTHAGYPADNFTAYGNEASAKQSGDLGGRLLGFQKAINSASFFSAELRVW
jgi:hypothetical protein